MGLYKKIGKCAENLFDNVLSATGLVSVKSSIDKIPKKILALFGYFISFPAMSDHVIDYNGRVWYLKINRRAEYTLKCIQNWINIAKEHHASVIFVCDRPRLKFDILRKCKFDGVRFCFIKSRKMKKIACNLYTGGWGNATYAHLTPIYHAAEHNVNCFWNIDADDTMFLLYPKQASEVLLQVEKISEKKEIDAFSLDMHRSKSYGVNWTLGILYIRNPSTIIALIEKNNSLSWGDEFKGYSNYLNFDWFLTYVKNHNLANIQTFYVNESLFIHWGEFLINPTAAWINYWHDGYVYYPILSNIFNMKAGQKPIADCICIDIGTHLSVGLKFWENEVCNTRLFTEEQRNLHQLQNEFCHSQHLIDV